MYVCMYVQYSPFIVLIPEHLNQCSECAYACMYVCTIFSFHGSDTCSSKSMLWMYVRVRERLHMYVYSVYICMYTYICMICSLTFVLQLQGKKPHTHIHTHIYTHIWAHKNYTYTHKYAHIHTYLSKHSHACTHTHIHVWIYIRMFTFILEPAGRIGSNSNIIPGTHIHTHTHTHMYGWIYCTYAPSHLFWNLLVELGQIQT
jgi:hypothetical protein